MKKLSHIAIVMDGNRRWAKQKNLPTIFGHREGIKTLKKIIRAAIELSIKTLTIFAFSTENWNREEKEVFELMNLLKYHLSSEINEINQQNIKIKFIGDISNLSEDIRKDIYFWEEKTQNNDLLELVVALNYGSREEIINATKTICLKVEKKELKVEDITETLFKEFLYTSEYSAPDLFIRTSGEYRISNFLLWQIAYTELYFSEKLWPDFSKEDLEAAINDYNNRERRYGK